VLRRISEPKRQEAGENFMRRRLVIFALQEIL
jgi:hypothetical protein